MNRRYIFQLTTLLFTLYSLLSFVSCREEDEIFVPETIDVSIPQYNDIQGFYLLNEGNMGTNKATLDYYDYARGEYTRNIFGNANPTEVKEMGDVGNDMAIYGDRLYCVINCSNKVDVLDKQTAKKIGQVNIPNCRYIRFSGKYAYVTSYAGPVLISKDYEQKGYVAKIDTASLEIVDTCVVGFQPNELEIADDKIYVANSGGYMTPNYENTISVIDMKSFKEVRRIPIAINLSNLRADKYGQLWITSLGDYNEVPNCLYCMDIRKEQACHDYQITDRSLYLDSLGIAVSSFDIAGDSLYFCASEFSYVTMQNTTSYGIINLKTHKLITQNFITDGTEASIKKPYCVKVNPITSEILVTDAKDYVNPGYLYCFSKEGKKQWSVRTGDIPGHIVFLSK